MLESIFLNAFERDIDKAKRRGKPIGKLKAIIALLVREQPLSSKHRNHKLKGEYAGYWECHIEPDWLLVYRKNDTHITFVKLGTHSDMF